jgi:malonyl-CoA O-methyltransferase
VSSPSGLELRAVRRNFDRAASSYAVSAVIAKEIHQRLLERLTSMRLSPARILDLGAGAGGTTRDLSLRFPAASLTALDLCQSLLRAEPQPRSWRRLATMFSGRRVSRVCADMHRLPLAPASIDLLWSNLALPWVLDLDVVLRECARVLAPGGLFIFSSCGPDTLRELRALSNLTSHLHAFPDMHDVGDALMRAGLANPVMEMDSLSISYPSAAALRQELRATGSGNALVSRRRGLGGRKFHAAWISPRRSADEKLTVTLEVVYGHAWKSEAKKKKSEQGERSVIQLHFPHRPR